MSNQPSPEFRQTIRTVAFVITAASVIFILSRAVVPEGRLTTTTDFSGPAPYLSEPKPSERIADQLIGEKAPAGRPVIGSPIYLDLKPPAQFKSVTMKLKYRNAAESLVEIGALTSFPDGQYDIRGGENRLLDSLGWERVSGNGVDLYQRAHVYSSVNDFLNTPPQFTKVASYQAEPPLGFRIQGYEPSAAVNVIHASLRGGHRILTYVKGEPLNFSFTVQDMNRELGADPVYVNLYQVGGEQSLASAKLPDDGNITDSQLSSGLRKVEVSLDAPVEGAYRIELTATPDIFIREIRTPQNKVVFDDRLFLGDFVGYSDSVPKAIVWTDGTLLTARTPHAEGMQTVSAGPEKLVLDQPNIPVSANLAGKELHEVSAPKRNVLLESDGVFALSESAWFNPLAFPINERTTADKLDTRGIDFVFANYAPPKQIGGTKEITETFDLSKLARTETGAYRFVISMPGFDDAGSSKDFMLESASFALRRDKGGFISDMFGSRHDADSLLLRVVPQGVSFGEKIL